jgi:uncharacterized protein
MIELSIFSAFLVGLLGGGHCIGMCGGFVGAISAHLPPQQSAKLPFLLAYNSGRILSYTLAGMIAGAIGASSFFLSNILPIQKSLYFLSSVILILLGLYLAGIWHGLTYLEKIGHFVWRYLQPYSKRFIPIKNLKQALFLGGVWGWLPCGLVYSVLIAAIASGDVVKGGLLMLAFGLGTLPTLLAMGLTAMKLKNFLQHIWVRRSCGLLVISFGLTGILNIF